MRFVNPVFHHKSVHSPDGRPPRAKLLGRTGPFRYLSPLSGPERSQPPAEPAPTPKWLEWSLIFLAVALAAFTVLHQPKPFAPQSHRAPIASSSPIPVPSVHATPRTQPASPASTSLPRDVTIARDLSITLDYGVIGLRKGQPVQLIEKTPSGYNALYEDYLLPLKDGDFQ